MFYYRKIAQHSAGTYSYRVTIRYRRIGGDIGGLFLRVMINICNCRNLKVRVCDQTDNFEKRKKTQIDLFVIDFCPLESGVGALKLESVNNLQYVYSIPIYNVDSVYM